MCLFLLLPLPFVFFLNSVVERFGDTTTRMLDTQYRMNQLIMQFSSQSLYDGKLKAHQSVASHLLTDLPSVIAKRQTKLEEDVEEDDDMLSFPLVFFDTASCQMEESEDEESSSRSNEGEAQIVVNYVTMLIENGVLQSDIAVISPYK